MAAFRQITLITPSIEITLPCNMTGLIISLDTASCWDLKRLVFPTWVISRPSFIVVRQVKIRGKHATRSITYTIILLQTSIYFYCALIELTPFSWLWLVYSDDVQHDFINAITFRWAGALYYLPTYIRWCYWLHFHGLRRRAAWGAGHYITAPGGPLLGAFAW